MVSESVPEFAGFHYDESGDLIISLQNSMELGKLSPASVGRLKGATDAIVSIFGEDILTAGLASRRLDASLEIGVSQPLAYGTTYSFKELYKWYGIVTNLLDGASISFTDIDEVENRIVIALVPETIRESKVPLTEELGKTSVPIEAVKFIEEERVEPDATLRDRLRPVRGGSYMDLVPGTWCTLGMVVKIAGERGVLTNSHCSDKVWQRDSTKYYQNYSTTSN